MGQDRNQRFLEETEDTPPVAVDPDWPDAYDDSFGDPDDPDETDDGVTVGELLAEDDNMPRKKKSKAKRYSQWTSVDDTNFFPAGKTCPVILPGFYEPDYSSQSGYFLKKLETKTEDLIRFPETNSDAVIKEIKTFWGKEKEYTAVDMAYRMGILLYGPPGSGKSSTIQILIEDVIKRKGVALKFSHPDVFIENARNFREIQPDCPLIVLMEDIDATLRRHNESEVLNILDGAERIHKTVFIATTNYPEELGDRIVNRPSRFDSRFKMPHPSAESRKLYFDHFLTPAMIKKHKIDLGNWVKDTENMSVAHLKQLFINQCILGKSYKESIEPLKEMVENKISSKDDENATGKFGFQPKLSRK
tara:strand:+ start:1102 stop:2184 length:1083 start_codon:yes stop_codon:yes gene_type:complete